MAKTRKNTAKTAGKPRPKATKEMPYETGVSVPVTEPFISLEKAAKHIQKWIDGKGVYVISDDESDEGVKGCKKMRNEETDKGKANIKKTNGGRIKKKNANSQALPLSEAIRLGESSTLSMHTVSQSHLTASPVEAPPTMHSQPSFQFREDSESGTMNERGENVRIDPLVRDQQAQQAQAQLVTAQHKAQKELQELHARELAELREQTFAQFQRQQQTIAEQNRLIEQLFGTHQRTFEHQLAAQTEQFEMQHEYQAGLYGFEPFQD